MAKWNVTHTSDGENYSTTTITGTTFTDAYVNFSVQYPNEIITDLTKLNEDLSATMESKAKSTKGFQKRVTLNVLESEQAEREGAE